jgi:hypothetical protein
VTHGKAAGRAIRLVGWSLLFLAGALLPGAAWADGPDQVGLVVQFGDGRMETRCFDVGTEPINGADLLARSGLETIIDPGRGMGITVCQIEGEGCAFPAEACFCQCMGGSPCTYWNYYYRDPGETRWVYSPLGAALHKPEPGSVEAWVWGNGLTPPPEELTFEAICPAPTAAPTETAAEAPTDVPASATATVVAPSPPPAEATYAQPTVTLPEPTAFTAVESPVPAATPLPSAGSSQGPARAAPAVSGIVAFGVVVLGLAVIGLLVWLRRG